MKQQLITASIAAALILAGCGDSGATGKKQADETEARFKQLVDAQNKQLQFAGSLSPVLISNVSYTLDSYQKGEQESSAQLTMNYTINHKINNGERLPLILNISDKIDHADVLAKDGVLAKIYSTLSVPQETLDALKLTDKAQSAREALSHLKLETDLLADNKIRQSAEITPFKNDNIDFAGAGFTATGPQPDGSTLLTDSEGTFNFKGLTIKDDEERSTVIAPIDGTVKTGKDSYRMEAPKVQITHTGPAAFTLTGTFAVEGKNLKAGDGILFGTQNAGFTNAVMTSPSGSLDELKVNSFQLQSDTKENGALLNNDVTMHIGIDTDVVEKLAGIQNLKIDSIDAQYSLKNFSQKTYLHLQKVQYSDAPEAQMAMADGFVREAIVNKSEISAKVEVVTAAGNAVFTFNAKPRDGATAAAGSGAEALDSNLKQFNANAELVVPMEILKRAGVQDMAAFYANQYCVEESDAFRCSFEARDGSAFINGRPL